MRKLSLILFFVLLALIVGHGLYYYPHLPEMVASHFDGSGEPDSWMAKKHFITFYFAMTGFLAILFIGISLGLSKIPVSLINLPNKDYWLSDERKAGTFGFMSAYFLLFGSITLLLLLDIFHQSFQVTLGKADSLPHFMLSLGLYIGLTTLWMIGLLVKFGKAGRVNLLKSTL